jgi:hypothetical protein
VLFVRSIDVTIKYCFVNLNVRYDVLKGNMQLFLPSQYEITRSKMIVDWNPTLVKFKCTQTTPIIVI